MDDGWDVTIQLQRRFSKNPFSQPINPDTNLRFTSDPDGWTIEYYIDRPSYHSESDEIIAPVIAPSPQTIIDFMGHEDFLSLCTTLTPVFRRYRATHRTVDILNFWQNPA